MTKQSLSKLLWKEKKGLSKNPPHFLRYNSNSNQPPPNLHLKQCTYTKRDAAVVAAVEIPAAAVGRASCPTNQNGP